MCRALFRRIGEKAGDMERDRAFWVLGSDQLDV